MKPECAYTRNLLRRYHHGHLFAPDRKRVERHLTSCPFCQSEYQAYRHAHDTKELLRDITPPEGLKQRMKARVSKAGTVKKLLYRPLYIAGIITLLVASYVFVIDPFLHDPDLEQLGADLPAAELSSAQTATPAAARKDVAAAAAPTRAVENRPQAPAEKAAQPLIITISAADEEDAMRHINAVMQGHAVLRTMRFTPKDKEISGNLTAKELLTFFGRIREAGRISYSRARLESFPDAEALPFVMRLKTAARTVEKAAAPPAPENQPEAAAPAGGR